MKYSWKGRKTQIKKKKKKKEEQFHSHNWSFRRIDDSLDNVLWSHYDLYIEFQRIGQSTFTDTISSACDHLEATDARRRPMEHTSYAADT